MSSILKGIFSNDVDFFYSLGYFGEYITFFITCALIYNQQIYFVFYILFFLLNKILNESLKKFFKQYRPNKPIKFLDSDQFSRKKFGMPSGHSQLTFFSIIYAYLVTHKFIPWILFLLTIGIIVIYERYKYRNHTVNQLITGAILGSFIAYSGFYLVNYLTNL
jgi:membrane-associated phospholipid phosphatase